MSVTGAAPFTPSTDQNLSVAYISTFILVFIVRSNFDFKASRKLIGLSR